MPISQKDLSQEVANELAARGKEWNPDDASVSLEAIGAIAAEVVKRRDLLSIRMITEDDRDWLLVGRIAPGRMGRDKSGTLVLLSQEAIEYIARERDKQEVTSS